ncbi:MAG: flagellar hook-basal body complex protein [Oscillospiraceae bacterium]|nr:flagellar hook-basal body complex protein [Oscillospiraceae bacterium]
MLRSMFSGVSGLRNHQIKMDVIGNNIANVNTVGYKMSRTTFQEMYSQTLRSASAATGTAGGTNPQQVGLGVSTAAIDVVHEGGAMQSTDRALDFAVSGDGFFIVQQGDSRYYTRAGNLYLDDDGFLVTANGLFVQGVCLLPTADIPTGVDRSQMEIMTQTTLDGIAENTLAASGDTNLGRILIPEGKFTSFAVDKRGLITGIDSNDNLVPIGQILTATFVNPPGLTRLGNNLYEKSNNSGTPQIHRPSAGGAGEIISGSLEMSNVDLSREFTDMIITQRGFQANSRVITVSDTLLEELINLKR